MSRSELAKRQYHHLKQAHLVLMTLASVTSPLSEKVSLSRLSSRYGGRPATYIREEPESSAISCIGCTVLGKTASCVLAALTEPAPLSLFIVTFEQPGYYEDRIMKTVVASSSTDLVHPESLSCVADLDDLKYMMVNEGQLLVPWPDVYSKR